MGGRPLLPILIRNLKEFNRSIVGFLPCPRAEMIRQKNAGQSKQWTFNFPLPGPLGMLLEMFQPRNRLASAANIQGLTIALPILTSDPISLPFRLLFYRGSDPNVSVGGIVVAVVVDLRIETLSEVRTR